nr:MAG TPA: hypothetical protein [Caudoviricetes sp.]
MKHTKPLTQGEKQLMEQNALLVDICKAIPPADTMVNLSRNERQVLDTLAHMVKGICSHTLTNDYCMTRYSPRPYQLPHPLYFRYILDVLIEKGYKVDESCIAGGGYIEYTIAWNNEKTDKVTINTVTELVEMLDGLPTSYIDFKLGDDYQIFLSGPLFTTIICYDVPQTVYETVRYSAGITPGRYYDLKSVINRLTPYKEENYEVD